VQLAAPPALDVGLTRDSPLRRGRIVELIVEVITYLQHRQAATEVSVTQYARVSIARAAAHERRHGDVLERLARIEGRLSRLDEQVDGLRLLTRTLHDPRPDLATAPCQVQAR